MPTKLILKSNFESKRVSKNSVISDHVIFVKLTHHPSFYLTIQRAFKKIIEPTYGDQKNALVKIKESLDRTCEIMLVCNNPVGLIVYKNELQNEYGFEKALELKTLFIFNPDKNSGHGFGSKLFQRIDNIAQEKGTSIVYCTASSKVDDSIKCAIKNGYQIRCTYKKKEDGILYVLAKDLNLWMTEKAL